MALQPALTLTSSKLWMQQFAGIEAGIPRSWEQLADQHASQSPDMPCHDIEPEAFPGQWQIRMLIAKLKRDKVPGPNLIPPALLKAGGHVAAKQLSVLYAKAAANSREPLPWKGGVLIPLWKGKLAPSLQVDIEAFLFRITRPSFITSAFEPTSYGRGSKA